METPHTELTHDALLDVIQEAPRYVPDSRSIIDDCSASTDKPAVLVPGTHHDRQGRQHEIGGDRFTDEVLDQVPDGELYRKDHIVGQIIGSPGHRRFRQLTTETIRLLVDRYLTLTRLERQHGKNKGSIEANFVPCTQDHGRLIIAAAGSHLRVPEVRLTVTYPIFMPDWSLAAPGFHQGVYFDQPPDLVGIEPIRDKQVIRDTLHDLVIDFPFATEADLCNFIGLLLTPIVRWALQANIPLHIIMAPIERTGKTKLAEQVFGGVLLGPSGVPAMQLPDREEETEKRILAILLKGDTLCNLDNIRAAINSASLASLLTARNFTGRVLGVSKMVTLPNNLTLVGTGNNVTASGEIAKRSIPICLQPKDGAPEDRTDFRHPDLTGYVRSVRCKVLACLIGMVQNWLDADQPKHPNTLGGFEAWSAIVGGILHQHGFDAWRTNERTWRRTADPEGEDLLALVEAWWTHHRDTTVAPKILADLARRRSLFPDIFSGKSLEGAVISFSRRVLLASTDRPVDRWIIRRHTSGNNPGYRLESPFTPGEETGAE